MSRRMLSVLVAGLLAVTLPAVVAADTPRENHVLSRDAYAVFSSSKDCITATVYVSSSRATFMPAHGTGGGATHQGLTSVQIFVERSCSSLAAAAGGGGGDTEIADWFGQSSVPLIAAANLAGGQVHGTVPLVDRISGAAMDARLDLTWRATGPAIRGPVHYHHRYPHLVILNTNSNDFYRDAIARGTVVADGVNWAPTATAGQLMSTRFHCRQIGQAHNGSDWGLCY